MPCKKGEFDVVELMVNDQFKTFSINLNALHVNGMTPFNLSVVRIPYICIVRLLDTLEYLEKVQVVFNIFKEILLLILYLTFST